MNPDLNLNLDLSLSLSLTQTAKLDLAARSDGPPVKNDIVYVPYEIIQTSRRPTTLIRAYDYLRQLINREYTTDLRCKLAIVLRGTPDSESLLVTIMRMDNLTPGQSGDAAFYYKPIDKLWRMTVGWPTPLELYLLLPRGRHLITVPASPSSEVLQVETSKPPGLHPSNSNSNNGSSSSSSDIPKKIFQNWHDQSNVPRVLQKAMWTFKTLNPHYQHHLFDEAGARKYIAHHESDRVLKAYDLLQPPAYKSDLWRYVVLYHEGGIYADIKMIALAPLDYFLPAKGGVLVNDIRGAGILNAFMALPPGDILMRRAIDKATENVENRYYGQGALAVTGPALLAGCLAELAELADKAQTQTQTQKYTRLRFENTGVLIRHKGLPVLSQHNGEYRRLLSRPGMDSHYERAWLARSVYGETPEERITHGHGHGQSHCIGDEHTAIPIPITITIAIILSMMLSLVLVRKRRASGTDKSRPQGKQD